MEEKKRGEDERRKKGIKWKFSGGLTAPWKWWPFECAYNVYMGSNDKSRMKISTATITKQSGEARCPRSPIIHTSVRISLKLAMWNTRSRKEKQESRRATVKRTVVGPTTTRNRIFSTLFFSYPLFSLSLSLSCNFRIFFLSFLWLPLLLLIFLLSKGQDYFIKSWLLMSWKLKFQSYIK